MVPRHRVALGVDGAAQAVVGRGTVEVVLHVVFAGPEQLHGRADRLADLGRLDHEVRLVAPAETPAHERRVNVDRRRGQARDLGDRAARPVEPQLPALVVADVGDRLHHREGVEPLHLDPRRLGIGRARDRRDRRQ